MFRQWIYGGRNRQKMLLTEQAWKQKSRLKFFFWNGFLYACDSGRVGVEKTPF